MPPPRASRLNARKSIVPDPQLYSTQLDSDDDDAAAPPSRTAAATAAPPSRSSATAASTSTAAAATLASNTTANSRRRSTRLSTESAATAESTAPSAKQPSSRAGKAVPKSPSAAPNPPKSTKVIPRSRSRQERAEEEQDDGEQGDAPAPSATAVAKSTTRTKRQKVDPQTPPSPPPSAPAAPAPAPRAGFKPRAVPSRGARAGQPKELKYVATTTGDEDDSGGFAFATNPPTPYVAPEAKRTAAGGNGSRGAAARTTTNDTADPIASTSQLSPPTRRGRSASAPIHIAETPVQVRNVAFRAGEATPGTAGRSARRSSVKGSGRRGSSIGGGFEATPHPQVPDDKLYRSTDGSEPLARRLRSIFSWTAQRQREKLFPSSSSTSSDPTQAFAKQIIDGFITDICESRVDVSVPFWPAANAETATAPGDLPPHPQNESNAAKMIELEANYAAIALEQSLRDSVKPLYAAFEERRAEARDVPLPSLPHPLDSSAFNLVQAGPGSLEEALKLGREILEADVGAGKGKSGKKGKGKGKEKEAVDELSETLKGVRLETATFHHLTHRISQFTTLATTYVSTRTLESHRTLSALAATTSSSTAAAAGQVNERGGVAPALAWGVTSAAAGTGQGSDTRDLLRAIASADARSRQGGGQ